MIVETHLLLPHVVIQRFEKLNDFVNQSTTVVTESVQHVSESSLRVAKMLDWGVHHPIISLVILVFALATVWSLIKAVSSLIESASLSLLRVPLRLLQALMKVSFLSFIKVSKLAIKHVHKDSTINEISALPCATSQTVHQQKQQRLTEISHRLREIHREQNELLEEAAAILASEQLEK
jgi:hypothetical protein